MSSRLQSLLNRVDWLMLENSHGKLAVQNPNSLKYSLEKDKKNPENYAQRVNLFLGSELLKKLGWEFGNKVAIFFPPDDSFAFKVICGNNIAQGYKLSKLARSPIGTIKFKWPHKNVKVSISKAKEIEYMIDMHGALIFRIDDNEQ